MTPGDRVYVRSECQGGWIEDGPALSGLSAAARYLCWYVRLDSGEGLFVPEAHLEPAECPIRLRVRPTLRLATVDGVEV